MLTNPTNGSFCQQFALKMCIEILYDISLTEICHFYIVIEFNVVYVGQEY